MSLTKKSQANPTFQLSPGRWLKNKSRLDGVLSGSALFLVSTTIVNGGNYLFNLILGRWLGPADFAEVSIIITLFLFLTFVTAGFQQTAAKFSAKFGALGQDDLLSQLHDWLSKWAWRAGFLALLIVGVGAWQWQSVFHTTSPWIFVLFALGLPFYFAQGIDRGILQGQTRFGSLAVSYQVEMWVRLIVGILLVAVGFAVYGAITGLVLSLVATWLITRWAIRRWNGERLSGATSSPPVLPLAHRQDVLAFAFPVLMAEVSLILINNSDVLIVKSFFDNVSAGHYAALALIGRIVFFATWSVVMTMFPIVAQRHERQESTRDLLWLSLGMVSVVSLLIVVASYAIPDQIIMLLFGSEYLAIAPLLWLYAIATSLFALANVLINYRLALGNRIGTVIALAAGAAQVILLLLFHASLEQVVLLQIALMGVLLFILVLRECGESMRLL